MSEDCQTIEFPVLLQPGDIVACWGDDHGSWLISLWTSLVALFAGPRKLKWAPSHVAIIGHYRGLTAWYESTTKCKHPCLHRQQIVNGFQVHDPQERINDYVNSGGRIAVYRLSDFDVETFDEEQLDRVLYRCLEMNLRYSYAGAAFSGTHLFLLNRLVPIVDSIDVFCSEILSRILQSCGLQCKGDPRWFNPGRLIRSVVRPGTYVLHREVKP